MTFEQLVMHYASANTKINIVLERIGKEMAWRALRLGKSKFGKYNKAYGEFPGWAKLADSTIEEKVRLGLPTPSPLYRGDGWTQGGILRSSLEVEKEVKDETLVIELYSNDDRMLWHEFGFNSNVGVFVPPRPVVGPAMQQVVDRMLPTLIRHLEVAMSPGYSFGLGPVGYGGSMHRRARGR